MPPDNNHSVLSSLARRRERFESREQFIQELDNLNTDCATALSQRPHTKLTMGQIIDATLAPHRRRVEDKISECVSDLLGWVLYDDSQPLDALAHEDDDGVGPATENADGVQIVANMMTIFLELLRYCHLQNRLTHELARSPTDELYLLQRSMIQARYEALEPPSHDEIRRQAEGIVRAFGMDDRWDSAGGDDVMPERCMPAVALHHAVKVTEMLAWRQLCKGYAAAQVVCEDATAAPGPLKRAR